MPKKTRQKLKYIENEKSFQDEIKSTSHHFWRAIIETNNKKWFLGGESPTLSKLIWFAYSYSQIDEFYKIFWKFDRVLTER